MDKSKRMEARKVFESWNPSMQQKLDQYVRLFPEQYAKFADSERANIKGLKEHDLYALGRTLEQQTMLKPMTEEVSFSQLGAAPTLAYDFITALFGKSVIPYVASEQVIDEVQGLVYFENIVAASSRGNIEKDNILGKAAGVPEKYPSGFAGEMVYGEAADGVAVDGNTKEFTFTLKYAPVRPYYAKVICNGITAVDDGKGNLIGAGVSGKITYATGEVELTFLAAPAAESAMIANYATNFELGALPSITTTLDSKFVRANVYGLQTDTSVISSYMMSKRFNFDMQARAVEILQEQILNEITTELIMKVEAAVIEHNLDETMFDKAVPQGVSQQAHFNSVDYTFGVVAQKMAQRAGKGTLSVGLAGAGACAFLQQNAKFKRVGEATAFATVYGVYDNTTIIIRCPQLSDPDAIYFLYKGDDAFNAAAVYAPYMPLVGVEDLPVPTALLNRRSAVASMAAIDILVPGYIQKFKVVKTEANQEEAQG
jgi:hypothetical protein